MKTNICKSILQSNFLDIDGNINRSSRLLQTITKKKRSVKRIFSHSFCSVTDYQITQTQHNEHITLPFLSSSACKDAKEFQEGIYR